MKSTIPAPATIPASAYLTDVPEPRIACILPAPSAELELDEVDDNSADTLLAPAPDVDAEPIVDTIPRAWRPDLVPHIMAWLETIPADSLRHMTHVGVSELGGFEATFGFEGAEVRFGFEHPRSMVFFNPYAKRGMWWAETILPFEQRQLEVAARAL